MNLDFNEPEYGPHYLQGLIRESQAKAAANRRQCGIPDDGPGTFLGIPIVIVDELQSKDEGQE